MSMLYRVYNQLYCLSELIWTSTDTCVDFFALFLLWDDAFVFDKKSSLFRAITVHEIERWYEE